MGGGGVRYADAPHGPGYYRPEDAPPPDPHEQARAILLQAIEAGAALVACAEPIPGARPCCRTAATSIETAWRVSATTVRRRALAADRSSRRDHPARAAPPAPTLCGASSLWVGCRATTTSRAASEARPMARGQPPTPPPDTREYSRMVPQRASAAGAEFVRLDEKMDLPGYDHRDGAEGVGYYRRDVAPPTAHPAPPPTPPPPPSAATGAFDDFMQTMKSLGAV